ncbi:uncharacterized protein CPUR_05220 [Claviceps purpurea 20.1]|uniref:Uncharacterized protein n=1 Tax=Claviceps purpurea (strain 20.1) TaxID=1111077 RepID=M1VWJ2_CLAP2|nr:uncharacterized protein CPUR_05220 [Claviceps purpurea 20.1]
MARARDPELFTGDASKHDLWCLPGRVQLVCQKADVPSSKLKQTLWDVIPADIDTSLSKKSNDPDVDYEESTEDVSRAAYAKQRANEQRSREQRRKGRTSRYTEQDPKTDKERKRNRFKVSERRTRESRTKMPQSRPLRPAER